MRKEYFRVVLAGVLSAGVMSGSVLAATAAEVVKVRVDRYKQMGGAFKAVNDELKKGSPAPAVFQNSARQIVALARDQYKWFPRGSGPESGVKTKAKGEIWSNAAGFKKAQDAFAAQAVAFQKAAASGNIGQIRAAAKPLGATCSGCHRQFRAES